MNEAQSNKKKYLNRGFILILVAMAVSVFIFWASEPHDAGPFLRVVEFGFGGWFGTNMAERVFVDRHKAKNGNT